MSSVLERIPLMRHGKAASTAAMNAWRSMVDDAHGREQRARLAPGRQPDGPGNWLDVISPEECWRLLAPRRLGRIGFSAHSGHPVILPVNYVVHGRTIVIRSGRGPKLDAARRGDRVAFEVDDIDLASHTGWSITLTGHARWVQDPREIAALAKVDVQPWAAGPRDQTIVIEPQHLSGRRLRVPADPVQLGPE